MRDVLTWCQGTGRVLLVGMGPAADAFAELLQERDWDCDRFAGPGGALRTLHLGGYDVVLLLPAEPEAPYSELCRQIRLDERIALLPVFVGLAPEQEPTRARYVETGAECFSRVTTPLEVFARIVRAVQAKKALDTLEDATAVVTSLANAIEGRDPYTRGHVERVGTYAVAMGRRLGLESAELETLRIGGIVHDIGKVAIPDQILNKPGPLTAEEVALVQRHPVIGFDVLQPLRSFRAALPVIRWHHERPNGRGYPDGIGGAELPLLVRLVALADVFDALSTDRPYRPAFAPEQYRAILHRLAVAGDLDADLVNVLLEILEADVMAAPAAALARVECPTP